VEYAPKVTVSKLVNSLEGVSSLLIRKRDYPSIKKNLWGKALWSPSYFAGSCGGATIKVIRQYIEQQQSRDQGLCDACLPYCSSQTSALPKTPWHDRSIFDHHQTERQLQQHAHPSFDYRIAAK
jgi:hypothetical protein